MPNTSGLVFLQPYKRILYTKEINKQSAISLVIERIRIYAALSKMRLSILVVFSASVSYLLAAQYVNWFILGFLSVGGFLVTASSNAFNQIIEKDLDVLMNRTQNRPLPLGQIGVNEALMFAFVSGLAGISILWFLLNPLSGLLGTLALILYVAVYTPLKRISPIAVFVGAFPGAIPPMLGYIAETGTFGLIPGLLFAVQFIWQFPHFWAIAWKLDDDYAKAGFRLLPYAEGKSKRSAFLIALYSLFLIPVSLTPYFFNVSGSISAIIAVLLGLMMFAQSLKLYFSQKDADALKLMLASFVYLPIVQIAYWLDKI